MRRHYAALAGNRWPAVSLQAILAPTFHGHAFSIAVELEAGGGDYGAGRGAEQRPPGIWSSKTRIRRRIWRRRGRTMCWFGCGRRLGRNPAETSRVWLWAASDNLRLHALNALECAMELRRLRPQGTVQ